MSAPRALRHAATLLGVVPVALCAWLPEGLRLATGAGLGRLAWRLARRRRRVVRTNLALCFPEMGAAERERLARAHFQAAGVALTDMARAWLRDARPLADRLEVRGAELLQSARATGQGVLLLGAHFLTLEIAAAMLATVTAADAVERVHDNPVIGWLQRRGRLRYFGSLIDRRDVRTLVRRLRAGRVVWYAFDQDPGPRNAAFAPFFGIPAATVTAPLRMARRTDVVPLFVSHWREPDGHRLVLAFRPLPADFPSHDDARDAATLNAVLEADIRERPAQYLWLHRRFKTRPAPAPPPYP